MIKNFLLENQNFSKNNKKVHDCEFCLDIWMDPLVPYPRQNVAPPFLNYH